MGKCIMRPLTDEGVKKIRAESIKIIEDVGVKVSHEGAKKLLADAGAKVDRKTDLVLIPAALTERCLKKLPQRIVLGGRDPDKDIVLDAKRQDTYYRSMTGAEGYIALANGKYRKGAYPDVKDFVLVDDALENIHIVTAPYYCDPARNLHP